MEESNKIDGEAFKDEEEENKTKRDNENKKEKLNRQS